MGTETLEVEVRRLLDEWNRAILERDLAAAARLREDGYTAALPDGAILSKEEEVALLASPGHVIESIKTRGVEVEGRGDEATALVENQIEGEFLGERFGGLFRYTLSLRKSDGVWRVRSSRLVMGEDAANPTEASAPTPTPAGGAAAAGSGSFLRRLVPRPFKEWLKGGASRVVHASAPTFPELAYLPYKPGLDYALPPPRAEDSGVPAQLPIPPTELWLGYNYPAHGRAHVEKMLEVVYASGFSFSRGDRILDLGCGAGRMIRHLRDLAETCEIWGTDISAEHVYWCKQNLSPPFNFATTTKVPHLPFEDRSFQLIYCGSVFTHIDDLADAWLLELKRVLAPGGRLYVTVHDNHTVELFESGLHDSAEIVRRIKSYEVYQRSKESFGMFAAGRDNDSQVFYDAEYFSKMLRPLFDILSVTPEAYFYQTAYLLKRK